MDTKFSVSAVESHGLRRNCAEIARLSGQVRSVVYDKDGQLKYDIVTDNLLVTLGKEIITDLLNASATQPGWISVGTDNGTILPLAVSNTQLGAEITDSGLQRASATKTQPTQTQAKYSVTYNVTGSKGIWETGLHNASSGNNNLVCRAIYNAVLNVENGDTFTQEWTLTVQ